MMNIKLGTVSVDSGTLLIGDPSYFEGGIDWPSIVQSALLAEKQNCVSFTPFEFDSGGLVLQRFGGDGEYDVIGAVDEDGLLRSVTITFHDTDGEHDE